MPWPSNAGALVLSFLVAVETLLSCAGRPDEAIPIIDATTSAVEGGRSAAAAWKAMARHLSSLHFLDIYHAPRPFLS